MWPFNRKPARVKELLQAFDIRAVEECRIEGWLEDGSLKNITLEAASLPGANLDDAELSDSTLLNADLSGASLRGAKLRHIDLSGADLSNANLEGADLSDAILSETNLTGATFREAQIVRADALWGATMPDGKRYDGRYRLPLDLGVAYDDGAHPNDPEAMAEWYEVPLKVYEDGQIWANAYLSERKVESEYLLAGPPSEWAAQMREDGSLTDGSLRGEDLRHENLMMSDLHDAVLPEVLLIGVDAHVADFSNANLEGADLEDANLSGAILRGTNLRNVNLTGADLSGADLEKADLTGAILDAATLTRANLHRATVVVNQLVYAFALCWATMPDGLTYDGRYELDGDLDEAERNGVDFDSNVEMAHWYNVEQSAYEDGMEWASTYLDKLRPEEEEE